MKKIVILSAGPGLPEIVKLHGHSSQWIPNILSKYNYEFIVKNLYLNENNYNVDIKLLHHKL